MPLDLKAVGADIYAGACHKWLCAPKGSAFLYVRREIQEWLDPLVVSWGYEAEPGFGCGIPFIDYHEWQGTRDLAAFLSVPSAIEFQARYDWDGVRRRCHALGVETRARVNALTGLEPLCPDDWFIQMFAARLPEWVDHQQLKLRLYNEHRIEVPIMSWNDQKLLRISFQAYNDQTDAEALLKALGELLFKGR
jgi:isopenicillin-N epimerase